MKKLSKLHKMLVEECIAEFATLNRSELKKLIAQEEKFMAETQETLKAHKISIRLAKKQLRKLVKAKKRGKHVK